MLCAAARLGARGVVVLFFPHRITHSETLERELRRARATSRATDANADTVDDH